MIFKTFLVTDFDCVYKVRASQIQLDYLGTTCSTSARQPTFSSNKCFKKDLIAVWLLQQETTTFSYERYARGLDVAVILFR